MDYVNEHLEYKQALDPFFCDFAGFFGGAAAGFFLVVMAFAREAACVGDARRFLCLRFLPHAGFKLRSDRLGIRMRSLPQND